MTQEEKEMLIKDLCGRLPYGVKVTFEGYNGRDDYKLNTQHLNSTYAIEYRGLKPYLRPLSSMTEEEREEYSLFIGEKNGHSYFIDPISQMDWLNKNMFDYRCLIEKGLAKAAPEGMYNS